MKKFFKEIIIGGLLIIICLLLMDQYCVINIIDSPCEVVGTNQCNCDSLKQVIADMQADSSIGAHCKDDLRYPNHSPSLEGGDVVDARSTGKTAVTAFKTYMRLLWNAHGTLTEQLPGNNAVYISKQSLDRIFDDHTSANGLACYFALDANKHFNIVFDAVTYDNGNYGIQLPASPGSDFTPVFMANDHSLCPTVCGVNEELLNQ